jgi:hypothetical protein
LRIPFDELASVEIGRGAAEKLSILDQDVDAHQMMELAGPMHLQMGGQMMTNDGMTLRFIKRGVYRLGAKTLEMKGGCANILRLASGRRITVRHDHSMMNDPCLTSGGRVRVRSLR